MNRGIWDSWMCTHCVCVCVCVFVRVRMRLSALQGGLWAAIRGEQEAHHCKGRKTPAVGNWWKGGRRDSNGCDCAGRFMRGKEGRSGEADPDLVKVSWPHLVTMQLCDIMRPVAVASASHYKSTTPSSQSSSLLRVTTPWGIEITASIYYTFAATAVKCKHRSVWAEGHWQRRLHSRRRFGKMPRARLVHHPLYLFSSNLRCCWVSTQGLMGKHCNCVECFRYGQWCPSWL